MPNGRGDGRIDLLQESRFWIRIFKEHALFIKLGLPCDRTDLINEAQTLFDELSALETELMARRNLDSRLAQEIAATVSELIEFKERVLRMQIQCEMYANLFPLLIDHKKGSSAFPGVAENRQVDTAWAQFACRVD